MSEDTTKLDLARRAVNCKHWRWMRGMAIQPMGLTTVCGVQGKAVMLYNTDYNASVSAASSGLLPDFDDPATVGCLLALVREAWGEDHDDMHARRGLNFSGQLRWTVTCEIEGWAPVAGSHGTEVEALVAALEAAP